MTDTKKDRSLWTERVMANDRWKRGIGETVDHDLGLVHKALQDAIVAVDIPTLTDAIPNPELSEAQIQRDVLEAVRAHTKVAWAVRVNSGALKKGKHVIRFGEKGMPDIMGQLKDGRMLGVECKRPGKKPTPEQLEFLAKINLNGGVAFVATCVQNVVKGLT